MQYKNFSVVQALSFAWRSFFGNIPFFLSACVLKIVFRLGIDLFIGVPAPLLFKFGVVRGSLAVLGAIVVGAIVGFIVDVWFIAVVIGCGLKLYNRMQISFQDLKVSMRVLAMMVAAMLAISLTVGFIAMPLHYLYVFLIDPNSLHPAVALLSYLVIVLLLPFIVLIRTMFLFHVVLDPQGAPAYPKVPMTASWIITRGQTLKLFILVLPYLLSVAAVGYLALVCALVWGEHPMVVILQQMVVSILWAFLLLAMTHAYKKLSQ